MKNQIHIAMATMVIFCIGITAGIIVSQHFVLPIKTVETFNGYDYGKEVGKNEGVNMVSNKLYSDWKNTGQLRLKDRDTGTEVIFVPKKSEQ